ncbi:MAG: inositol monophosphatase [Planctomyces sp.]|nr:inositol monophosphatase [Planctomyces sp.]
MDSSACIDALRQHAPPLLRWGGAVARKLRQFNIALTGKQSGNANTDALTLADLSVQELVVAGLRDADLVLRECRIEAEESNGDLAAFREDGPLVIALDPIDGTKQFRDRTGDGYAVMLHLRNRETVLYSLVYAPEMGPHGTWTEAVGDEVRCGADDWSRPAAAQVASLTPLRTGDRKPTTNIYLIGFQQRDVACAQAVTRAGLQGFPPDAMPGSIYPLMATGEFGGSLIHSPNIYDFPVALHLARVLGGDAVWVHDRRPVHFGETWLDDRADMLRLPGIVACAIDPAVLNILCDVAKDWNPVRYAE